jgi:hypothetical protein
MSAEKPLPSSETKASPAPGPLTFIAGNIASLSAIGLFAAVVGSTLFLYAYLSVFDWRLIWIIDYSDIFKVGLVTLAVLSSFVVLVLQGLQMVLGVVRLEERARTRQIWFLSILGVIILAALVFARWREGGPYELHTAWASAAILVLALCALAARFLTVLEPSQPKAPLHYVQP